MRILKLLSALAFLTACELRDDSVQRAAAAAGTTEQQIRAAAGNPSRMAVANESCRNRGGVRVVAYDSAYVVLGKEFKGDRSVEFCVDALGNIKDTTFVQH